MLFLEERIETQGFLETKGGFLMLTITRAVLANPQSEVQFPPACRTGSPISAKAVTHFSALPAPGIERSCPHNRTMTPDSRKELRVATPT